MNGWTSLQLCTQIPLIQDFIKINKISLNIAKKIVDGLIPTSGSLESSDLDKGMNPSHPTHLGRK